MAVSDRTLRLAHGSRPCANPARQVTSRRVRIRGHTVYFQGARGVEPNDYFGALARAARGIDSRSCHADTTLRVSQGSRDTGAAQHTAGAAARGVAAYVAELAHRPEELSEQEARAVVARTFQAYVILASFAGPTGDAFAEAGGCSATWSPGGLAVAAPARTSRTRPQQR